MTIPRPTIATEDLGIGEAVGTVVYKLMSKAEVSIKTELVRNTAMIASILTGRESRRSATCAAGIRKVGADQKGDLEYTSLPHQQMAATADASVGSLLLCVMGG